MSPSPSILEESSHSENEAWVTKDGRLGQHPRGGFDIQGQWGMISQGDITVIEKQVTLIPFVCGHLWRLLYPVF